MNPFDLVIWYIHFMFTHLPIVIVVGATYLVYNLRKDKKYERQAARYNAALDWSRENGVTFAEAHRTLFGPTSK